ncbi:MAG: hypothetical protein RIQ93_2542, partial [Verrucomicrobiota bacterium]
MVDSVFRRRSMLPYFIEVFVTLLARALYRVSASGKEHFPATGGVVLITNHISYVDVVVLQLACPRPIRFVGYKGLRHNAFFDFCFDITGCIPVATERPMEAIRTAVGALKRGEVICLCP